jgi:hypothetical protein
MKSWLTLLLVAVLISSLAPGQANSISPATSMERKLQHIETNGAAAHPDQSPTELTEQEVNAYFAAGKVKLPVGVESVIFQGQPGTVRATARVDFDKIKAGQRNSNPLLSVFSGIHNVVVDAHAHGAGGKGFVTVDAVSLDDIELPRFVLQMFADKYIKPKYPNLGMESQFALPDHISTATVGLHTLTVVQK